MGWFVKLGMSYGCLKRFREVSNDFKIVFLKKKQINKVCYFGFSNSLS